MAAKSPKLFLPTAEDVLNADLPRRGGVLLIVLKSHEGGGTIYRDNGGINREYFFGVMDGRNMYLGPSAIQAAEYGADQPKVSMAFREAWIGLKRKVI